MPAVVECVACSERFEVAEVSSPSPEHKDKKGKACVGGGMISKVIETTDAPAPDSEANKA